MKINFDAKKIILVKQIKNHDLLVTLVIKPLLKPCILQQYK